MNNTTTESVTTSILQTTETVDTNFSSTELTQGHTETNTVPLVSSSGTEGLSTGSSGPGLEPRTTTTGSAESGGLGVTIGVAVGVTLVVVIAAVVIVIILCKWCKKKKVAKETHVYKRSSSTMAPGMKTIKQTEDHHRPPLPMKEGNEDSDDEDSHQRYSDTTFTEIIANIPGESTTTKENSRKESLWNLPDISHWSSTKTKKSKKLKKSFAPTMSEVAQEPVGCDEATGLPIYPIERPTSANSSRKKSIQNMLGFRKKSYSMNPDERKDSIFQLPDLSSLMNKKKKSKWKSKTKAIDSHIGEDEEYSTENVDATQTNVNMSNGLSSEAVANQQWEQQDKLNARKPSNPYAQSLEYGSTEEEYTALQPTVTHGKMKHEAVVEQAKGNNISDTGHKVEYANLKSVTKVASDQASSSGDRESPLAYPGNAVDEDYHDELYGNVHQSETPPAEQRASSVVLNVADAGPNDLFAHIEDEGDPSRCDTPHIKEKRASSIYQNLPHSVEGDVHQEEELPVRNVEYPLDYTPSQTHRPSGPYVNVPVEQAHEKMDMRSSDEDLFKRYS